MIPIVASAASAATTSPAPNPRRPAIPVAATRAKVGEYYWGYGSGIVVTKVPRWGEFVLAELTQPFDHGDVSYFFPLMSQVEQRLGYRPRFGTFDAAFDAWYVYAHFYRENDPAGGFAAVPFSGKGGYTEHGRQFDPAGLPLCAAGLAMPLKFTFTDRTTCLVEHERGKYVCPLQFPALTRRACPVRHRNWKRGGCTAVMPTSIGARLRYTLDRDSELYKSLYRQRTAVERINSQAVALGIERPHLRNGTAIANQNTLIYILINLRFLQRLHLLVGIVDQLDRLGRTLAGAGAAALALCRVDVRRAAQAADARATFLLDHLRDVEGQVRVQVRQPTHLSGSTSATTPPRCSVPCESRVSARRRRQRVADALLDELGIVRHARQEHALAHEIHRAQLEMRFLEEAFARKRHAQHRAPDRPCLRRSNRHAERHQIGGQRQPAVQRRSRTCTTSRSPSAARRRAARRRCNGRRPRRAGALRCSILRGSRR